jgi:hypothetical protein
MRETLTRRSLLECVGVAAGVLATMPVRTLGAADPVASALGYTEDATKVGRNESPSYRPGNDVPIACRIQALQARRGACKLFAGKLVNEYGWCRGYLRKD